MVSQQGLHDPALGIGRLRARVLVALGWAVCVAGGVLLPPAGLSRCTVALARQLLWLAGGSCRTLRVRVACEVASDFACDLPLLPQEAELPQARPTSRSRC